MYIKKIFSVLFIIIATLLIASCDNKTTVKETNKNTSSNTTITNSSSDDTYILPDLDGKSTDEVINTLKAENITNYVIKVKSDLTYGEGGYEYNKFYGYAGSKATKGTSYSKSKKLTVYVTAYDLPESLDDFINQNPTLKELYKKVTLDSKTYEGKSFIETGCGEVSIVGYVDGDTTRFRDENGTTLSLRYLGIDTPESTAVFEPWGKAASAYTEESLKNAKKVVLEADEAGQTDSNGRYLGWVWYQNSDNSWHLLNLELILFCYTKDKASSDSSYGELATSIGTIVGQTGRRVWGEHDPNYDYSTDPKEITIKELRTNFAAYYAKKVKITGVIALVDGQSAVIVDPETNYGVYYYIPSWFKNIAYNVEAGNKVTIIGTATYYGSSDDEVDLDSMDEGLQDGSPQLTDFKEKNITVLETGVTVNPVSMKMADVTSEKIGMYVTMTNLTVKKVKVAGTDSGYTVYCKDSDNNEVAIRVDNSHYHTVDGDGGINSTSFTVGQTIKSVTGYIAYYYGYQISVTGASSFEFDN